jgi:hypothetical protein
MLLLFLIGLLYLSLHHAINHAPPVTFSFDKMENTGSLAQFNLKELEDFLQKILEKLRSGKSISYDSEMNLKNIKALLALYNGANQELVAKLIALINEILELNDELIHLEDGERRTDHS